jgi:hypothetical protein
MSPPEMKFITTHISRKKALITAEQFFKMQGEEGAERIVYVLEREKGHAVRTDHFYLIRCKSGEYAPAIERFEPIPEDAHELGSYVPEEEDPAPEEPDEDEDEEIIDEAEAAYERKLAAMKAKGLI